ncbi:hypothetical protein TSAR_010576 [Trichomalopsis sarcophagae]|uniref:Integrase p58-like C-terminal domain-containing protein n=1 Tax=Trichomalopsis sarcophagae TaxID=543379 RepID=A0A232EH00_9HYME|nr:hypothetical protein TSAR_010576 [Trichomalopsis sarcophagae]
MARDRINLQSEKTKSWYDKRALNVEYSQGQKVWFFNPRRTEEKAPKLQSNWEGHWEVVKKINDVVYCIRRSPRHKSKIVNINRLGIYTERDTPSFCLYGHFKWVIFYQDFVEKVIVISGDFRQTLPIVRHRNRTKILKAPSLDEIPFIMLFHGADSEKNINN